jgi:hypothetical protein
MKRWISTVGLCLLVVVTAMGLLACGEEPKEPAADTGPVYDTAHLPEYVRLDAYTDLSVSLNGADESRGDAVWQAVLARAEVLSYPEEALDYYARQDDDFTFDFSSEVRRK